MRRCKEDDHKNFIRFYTKLSVPVLNSALFESLCKKRFKILKRIESESSKVRDTTNDYLESTDDDINSHFALKLISAQTITSMKSFIRNESMLFARRLENFHHKIVEDYFYTHFLRHLTDLEIKEDAVVIPHMSFYSSKKHKYVIKPGCKVVMYFSKVPDIIGDSFPEKGFVMNGEMYMKSCILTFYREYLEKSCNQLYFRLKNNPDERIQYIHDLIYVRKPVVNQTSFKTIETNFPPCITGLMHKLKTLKHLKYKDRLILTRFLKDSGIPVDDTITFFRSNFNVSETVFKNKYLYSIRHVYGLEGKRANYTSYDCKRVIASHDRETFGCPFKSNPGYLKEYANEKGLDIEDLGDCQKSCSKVLEVVSGRLVNSVITKPIDFLNHFNK